MNERIRLLAVQAGAGEWGDSVVPAMMDIEKFAEQIIRECAEVARLNTRVDSKVYLMIQEHFGVDS